MKMPVLDVGLPESVSVHKSGGRDRWSEPMPAPPGDPDEALLECLREVLDPEIPISVVDLGLIYGARMDEGVAHVDLTFTATACPCMEFIREDVSDRLLQECWVDRVEIHEVWDPPWSTDRITETGRATLKALGVGAV
ncbi:MAG: metal-sulfur cluster assembly factor [Gemmatimonadota bacterium]|jgi:metal-sulfur cluster biosynthetic enzyme